MTSKLLLVAPASSPSQTAMYLAKQYLLIDNSNTRTKFVLSTPNALTDEHHVISTRDITAETLAYILRQVKFDAAIISSVVPKVRDLLVSALPCPVHVLSSDSILPIQISYPRPQEIGADRLANAVGVTANYAAPAIVVDFGTAVTFDVIGAEPNNIPAYLGGVIAPGLAAMSDYLSRNTALLPTILPHEPTTAIGKSTEDAMHAGAVYGYRGLVKEIIARISLELPSPPVVVATGGDAKLIADGVTQIHHVDSHITLNGLRIIANLNLPI